MDTASANANSNSIDPSFILSHQQEELLYAALNSNNPDTNKAATFNHSPQSQNRASMPPSAFTESPLDGAGSLPINGFEESPFIDYDYEFDPESGFDYDFTNDSQQMIGKLPGTSSDGDNESPDKRSHPEDEDDNEEGRGKRREGDEKQSKKPGRKPLTAEPTSKRKAQNRAAQRAFRERKEKHLKDLETKVEDLQKASESANHENSILRAQVEKMSMELREYRKRLSLTNGSVNRTPSLSNGLPSYLSGKGANNPNDVNFQFEFPKFGLLPGPSKQSPPTAPPKETQKVASPVEISEPSPLNRNGSYQSNNSSSTGLNQTPLDSGDMSGFSALFSPTLLESVNKSTNSSFDFFTNPSRSSTNSSGQMSNGQSTSHSSPSASSNSNRGASSSCGTSPEPSMQSPAPGKPAEATLSTIGEEHAGNTEGTFQEPGFDVNGIDWFAQQNGNQFDPQLFGDYREPQDNILSNDVYTTDGFFNDAFAMPEFTSPFATSPATSRKDKVSEDDEVVPAEDTTQLLTCNTIWDRLQACPKVKEGEFDLDLLCKDLQKKAKCSETGAVVNESDFNKIMKSYVGQEKPSYKA